MLCQQCKERDATVHYTKIVNNDKQEYHLCEQCARERGDFMVKDLSGGFSFHNLLSGLLGFEGGAGAGLGGGMTAKQQQPAQPHRCGTCGLTYQQFGQYGRFGCADCYTSFQGRLEPLIRRIHGGATTHTGKVPQRTGGLIKQRKELERMRQELQQKIQLEQFEEAAVLRDRIRRLEHEMNNPQEGV